MLNTFRVHTTVPASDLERARAWYEEKLGLIPDSEDMGGLWYECRDSIFALYPTEHAGQAPNTTMEWSVTGIESLVEELSSRGVVFDHYDMPGIEWEGDIAVIGPAKGCWFRDSEGNILALTELPQG